MGSNLTARRRANLVLGSSLPAAVLIALVLGSPHLEVAEILKLFQTDEVTPTRFIVAEFRAPRVAVGALVGFALGIGGALFQRVTRNPLGNPDILGFTASAATGALVASILLGLPSAGVALGALIAGLLVAVVLVALFATRSLTMGQLVICGFGISILASAVNTMLVLAAPLQRAYSAARWLLGTLEYSSWEAALSIVLSLLTISPLLLVAYRWNSVEGFDDDKLSVLGVHTRMRSFALIVVGLLFTSVGVAGAGPIALVGFAAPQAARLLYRVGVVPIVGAGVTGAILVTLADTLARVLLAPTQLPVGVVTVVIGGLLLVGLITRDRSVWS